MRHHVDNPLRSDLVQVLFVAQGIVISLIVLMTIATVVKALLF